MQALIAYNWDFSWVDKYLPIFLEAWWMTTKILIVSALSCLAIGLVVGPLLNSPKWYVRLVPRIYVEVFRLTPMILQIVFIFLVLPLQFGIRFNNLTTGILALSLNYGAFASVIFQAGIGGVPKGQREAAQAIGMTRNQVMRRIVLPQAVQKMLSPFGSMLIYLNKDTSLVSVIGVAELFNIAQSVGARLYRNIEILIFIAVLYLIINVPLAFFSEFLNKKYNSEQ